MENRIVKEACAEGSKNQSSAIENCGRNLLMNEKETPLKGSANDQSSMNSLPELTLDRLADANKSTLNSIYEKASAGEIPDGDTTGRAIFLPGTRAGDIISHIGDDIWKGKVFEDGGELVNKILGHKFVHADVQKGNSWFDGKESIIIDYKGKSLATSWIRDEIREVKPGLYLGKMYARLPFGKHADVLFFALETNKKS